MTDLELGSADYAGSLLRVKTALSHLETLLGLRGGYSLGGPSSRMGWTFFTLSLGRELEEAVASRFAGMIGRYGRAGGIGQFMADYLESRGCGVRVRAL